MYDVESWTNRNRVCSSHIVDFWIWRTKLRARIQETVSQVSYMAAWTRSWQINCDMYVCNMQRKYLFHLCDQRFDDLDELICVVGMTIDLSKLEFSGG
jgi:hypothetical protein